MRAMINSAGKFISAASYRFRLNVFAFFVLLITPFSAWTVTLELSGQATLRPQEATRALNITNKTIIFADETLQATARLLVANAAERKDFPVLVLQRQDPATKGWLEIHVFYRDPVTVKTDGPDVISPVGPAVPKLPPAAAKIGKPEIPPIGDSLVTKGRPEPGLPPKKPQLVAPDRSIPATLSFSYDTPRFALQVGNHLLRASARRANGTSVESVPLQLEVRNPPAVLTLLAMGGTCTDPDANTTHTSLDAAGITRNAAMCASRGVQQTYLGDLTPMASVNCNDPCNSNCMNFMEHLSLRIMNNEKLATRFDSIDNPGERTCRSRTNSSGIQNQLVFGKWRNTEEEPVCSTPIKFNSIIDNFVKTGGKSLILIGQSQGGAKLAGMVRDHWRWGNDLKLELLVLWDATSFDTLKLFPGQHPLIGSMGVERVGSRPLRTVSFYQYSNAVPFQNGAPLLDPSEQYNLDGCFSHNAIARSQFVHQKTAEVVKQALVALRDRARNE